MLHQFPIPEDEPPISEKEITQIGEKTLKLLEEPFTGRTLSFNQRTVLADIYLGTIEGKATLGEQIQQSLAVRAKKASAFAGSLKRALSQSDNGHSGLQTIAKKYPENRKLTGYYLRVASDPHQEQGVVETGPSSSEITEKIREIRLALIRQVRPADEERDAIPIEDSERKVILATIEDIRQEVDQALALTPHGIRKEAGALIKILLEASERGEAIMPQKKASLAIRKLKETLKRSHRINLAVKSQREQHHGQRFGYYIVRKDEKEPQKTHKKPTLPSATTPLPENQQQLLAQLIDRAIKQTHIQAHKEIIIFNALKTASAEDKQITQEYCRYIEYKLFKKTSPGRNFKDKLTEMQKIPEAKFGFTIEKTGPNAWQAVPSTDQKVLRPILAKIAKEKNAAAERNPGELQKRVQAGLRHLKVMDEKSLQSVFAILIQSYTDKQGLPIKELIKKAKIKTVRDQIDRWFKRVKKLNRDLPELLGFDVVADGADRYRLELTEHYISSEAEFSGRAAILPVPVMEGTNFDRSAFNEIMASPSNKKAARMAPRTKIALEILASYSEKGQAISACYWDAETSKSAKPDPARGQNLRIAIRDLLKRITNGKMTLHAYKLCTWYLSVDEPATEHPAQTPPETQQAEQQKPEKPKPAPPKHQPAKAQPKTTPAKPKPASPAKPRPAPAKPKPTPPKPTPQQAKKFKKLKKNYILETDGEIGAITTPEEILNPAAIIEEHDDDDYPHLPTTPLIEFQNKIINTARTILNSKTATLDSLKALKAAVRKLNTRKQSHLEKIKQDYLEKLNRVRQRAKREIEEALSQNPQAASLIPEYLIDQLFSV